MARWMGRNAVFVASGALILAIVAWGALAPHYMTQALETAMDAMIQQAGWFYVVSTAVFLGFCIFLGAGPYRHMKLGRRDEQPEYAYFTWLGLLFAAGMGVGLVFWGVGEPLSHLHDPPPGDLEPGSQAAAEHGLLLGVFHWGVHPWSIYAIVALGLAFAKFRKGLPARVSSAYYRVIGGRIDDWPGKTIDVVVIVATTAGIATSFGLSTLQVGSGLSQVFGLTTGDLLHLAIIVVVTVIFLASAVSGLNRGLRLLSIGNLGLAGVLLVAVIVLGPTVFILEHAIKTLGEYLASLPTLSLLTTPYTDNAWMGDWTLFYWAWIISWSPFVGTFIARVSRGRSLQEFMLGVLVVPAGISVLWFAAFGGTGIHLELERGADIAATTAETPEAGLFLVLEQLPGGLALSVAALALISIFFITSANSATYVLGVFSSGGDLDPPRRTLVVWGLLIAAIAAVLLLSGGLDGLQATAMLTALPFTALMLLIMVAVYRSLRREGIETYRVPEKDTW